MTILSPELHLAGRLATRHKRPPAATHQMGYTPSRLCARWPIRLCHMYNICDMGSSAGRGLSVARLPDLSPGGLQARRGRSLNHRSIFFLRACLSHGPGCPTVAIFYVVDPSLEDVKRFFVLLPAMHVAHSCSLLPGRQKVGFAILNRVSVSLSVHDSTPTRLVFIRPFDCRSLPAIWAVSHLPRSIYSGICY